MILTIFMLARLMMLIRNGVYVLQSFNQIKE